MLVRAEADFARRSLAVSYTHLDVYKRQHNGEPQAQTTGPRRPETLKNGFRPFGRNARPHVMNIQYDPNRRLYSGGENYKIP